MSTKILAIESSCDDTSAAIIIDAELISLGVSNQKIHAQYGGVVPELASRAHQQEIIPVVDFVMQQAGLTPKDIDAVAVTQGPGLLGSLLVGVNFAKSFALTRNLPIISVNHMEAHILAHMIEAPRPQFPFLCLTVSGGHTQIVKVNSPLEMIVLGETLDDAAGEAFDKTGKMMGLPYPAGPEIDKLAVKGEAKFKFPISQVPGYSFSFSGLKTAIRNFLIQGIKRDNEFISKNQADICRSVQDTIIRTLLNKLEQAARDYNIRNIAIAGGVSANSGLRKALKDLCKKNQWTAFVPAFKYCTDNAGMIAMAAHYKFENKQFESQKISPLPRMKVGSLS